MIACQEWSAYRIRLNECVLTSLRYSDCLIVCMMTIHWSFSPLTL